MTQWWNTLNLTQQIFAIFALPASAILIIQTALLLFGLGSHHDSGMDGSAHDGGMDGSAHDGSTDATMGSHMDGPAGVHGDGVFGTEEVSSADLHHEAHPLADQDAGLRVFTVRGLIAFFAVGGWTGIAMVDLNLGTALAAFLALTAGLAALFLVAVIIRMLLSLQSSGNLDIRNAVGGIGVVYLHIPGHFSGSGKITILVQERSTEIDAMTEIPEGIPTGRQVRVVGLRGEKALVRPIEEVDSIKKG